MRRGEIYLANFGKKYNREFGKIRPVLIIQNDVANRNIEKVAFKGVTVIPMTTILSGGDLRVLLLAREKLEKDSEICINELCTLDMSRLVLEKRLTVLTHDELNDVSMKLKQHLSV